MRSRREERRLVHVPAQRLGPYVPGLRALEAAIEYPAGERVFTIDHGSDYHAFFSGMGEAHFALALDGSRVVGNVVGVLKRIRLGERSFEALYVCDLKVGHDQRGRGVARRLLAFGLWRIIFTPTLRRARLLYGAAMRGAGGDVTRSARGLSPLHLARGWARSALYFAEPATLAALDPTGCPPSPDESTGLDLSPDVRWEPPGVVSTFPNKALRLAPDGRPWPLFHLPRGPDAWRPSFGHYLRACGQALVARGDAGTACFAIDERLSDHQAWLSERGLAPSGTFVIYGLDLAGLVRRAAWIHLASSEI